MKRITILFSALISLQALAAKWDSMNYGPYLSTSLEVPGAGIVNKGIAIRLDAGASGVSKGSAFMLYDTDLLNCAAGWTGGFIDWRGIAFDGRHNAHASIIGTQVFSNPVGLGWRSPKGEWADASRVKGLDSKMYGPLPRNWAHYKGLYVKDNRVVLSYTVGARGVFESPSLHGTNVFIRNLHIAPGQHEIVMQVVHGTSVEFHLPGNKVIAVVKPADETPAGNPSGQMDFGLSNTTISAWIKTKTGGTILSKAALNGKWVPNGKTFFVRGGRLGYDVGWVGVVQSQQPVADGQWHHVAATRTKAGRVALFIDGKPAGGKILASRDEASHIVRLGYTATDFMPPFNGSMDEVSIFQRVLSAKEIAALAVGEGPADAKAHWSFDKLKGAQIVNAKGSSFTGTNRGAKSVKGKSGEALQFNGKASVLISGEAKEKSSELKPIAAHETVIAVALLGDTGVSIADGDSDLRLKFPASKEALKLQVLLWRGKQGELVKFEKAINEVKQKGLPPNLLAITSGGPAKWRQTVETNIQAGLATGPYATDTFQLPDINPWKSWMRLGGFDFFKDNKRAAVCTWQGDVWIVSGLDQPKGKLTWRRIAAGMFQPLGLKIVDETIYVCCRDQITRLHDLNDDGEIDFYESFNNDHQVTEHFHEFAMDLQTDAEGNFYFAKAARHAKDGLVPHHGSIIKVSHDGSKSWRIANGFRAPNGVTVNGDGTFFASDQEGHWTPKNRINLIRKDGFYGYMGSYVPGRDPAKYDPPAVWIHNSVDRSPAQQLWVTSDKWGPLKGSLINLSYGTGRLFTVPYEVVNGIPQGGVARLPIAETPTGVMRGRFHPVDGQLYACGLFGWAGNKHLPGGFYRFRYTGKPLHVPVKYSVIKKGVSLTFSEPLDQKTASDTGSFAAEMCNYRRTAGYGSRDFHVSDAKKQGRDKLEIARANLEADGKTVTLQIPQLQKCMTLRIQYNLKGVKGEPVKSEVNCTVNVLK